MARLLIQALTALLIPLMALAAKPTVTPQTLEREIAARVMRVPELRLIRAEAEKLGVRVYLFGGTAAGFAHYVKWDLLREQGDTSYQPDRFDYDFTNIYRSTQDLDIVVDGPAKKAEVLRKALITKFPSFQGNKDQWEVRLLREGLGDKEALLENPDFSNQHTDSNSTGLIEVTKSGSEPAVRDLRDWNSSKPFFLRDVVEGKIHYYFSHDHESTSRAMEGLNPPILSVVRFLTKAFQYELEFRQEDEAMIKSIIDSFDPANVKSSYVSRWMEKNGPKLVRHAVNIEYAWSEMERLGLRSKLVAMSDPNRQDTMGWWLSKEPLRSSQVGRGAGKTARELGIEVVAHETNSFLAYESITRSHSGAPNVFISRNGAVGEAASFGDGFYTAIGRRGMRGTGLTIRFEVDPDARLGTDFKLRSDGQMVIFDNKRALRVIPEDLKFGLVGYLQIVGTLDASDRGMLEKLRRRVNNRIQILDANELHDAREFVRTHRVPAYRDTVLGEWLKLDLALDNVDILEDLVRQGYQTEQIVEDFMAKRFDRRLRPLIDLIIAKGDVNAGKSLVMKVLTNPFWTKDPSAHQWFTRLVQIEGVKTVATLPFLTGVRPGVDDQLMETVFKETELPIEFLSAMKEREWLGRPIFQRILESVLANPKISWGTLDRWFKTIEVPEIKSRAREAIEKFLVSTPAFDEGRSHDLWQTYMREFGSSPHKASIAMVARNVLDKFAALTPEAQMESLLFESHTGTFLIELLSNAGSTPHRKEVVDALRAAAPMSTKKGLTDVAGLTDPVDRVRESQLRAIRLSTPGVNPAEYDQLRQHWFNLVSSPLLHELVDPRISRIYLDTLEKPWSSRHGSAAQLRVSLAVDLSTTTLVMEPHARKLLKSILDSAKTSYEVRDAQGLVEIFDRTPFDYDKYAAHLREIGSSIVAEHSFVAFASTQKFDFDRYMVAFNKLKKSNHDITEARLGFLTRFLILTPKFDLKRHAVLVSRFKDVHAAPESWMKPLFSYALRNDLLNRDPSFARTVIETILRSQIRLDFAAIALIDALKGLEGGANPSQKKLFEQLAQRIEKEGSTFEGIIRTRIGAIYQGSGVEAFSAVDYYLNHVATDDVRTRIFETIASSNEKSMAYTMAPLFRKWSGLEAWLTKANSLEANPSSQTVPQRSESILSSLSIIRGAGALPVSNNFVIDRLMKMIDALVVEDRAAAARVARKTTEPSTPRKTLRQLARPRTCENLFG